MDQLAIAFEPCGVDVAAFGYDAVRAAFQHTLGLCTKKLVRADLQLAADVLRCDIGPDLSETIASMVMDAALYSRPGKPWRRRSARRAVDRMASNLPVRHDPLMASLTSRLTTATYSVFEVEKIAGDGAVGVRDVLDEFRPLKIMDMGLASTARPGTVFAGRFLDAGPWRIGFGIVHVLTNSEAAAICLAFAHRGQLEDKRDALHELVYASRIHGDDLVLVAITPLIAAVSVAIDASDAGMASILAELAAAPSEPKQAAQRANTRGAGTQAGLRGRVGCGRGRGSTK
jgi:hypothetical protein